MMVRFNSHRTSRGVSLVLVMARLNSYRTSYGVSLVRAMASLNSCRNSLLHFAYPLLKSFGNCAFSRLSLLSERQRSYHWNPANGPFTDWPKEPIHGGIMNYHRVTISLVYNSDK